MAKSSFYSDGGTTSNNVSSITSLNNEATASKNAAKVSEDAAAASATASANSATASATSANSITGSVTSAQAAQTAAEAALATTITHKNTATTQASSATSSASTATTKAAEASASASTASTKASEASTSATNAATSNTNAGNSATSASTSASTATTKASEASTSATNAASSSTSASNSATTATTKASEASTSASTATTKASEAASSATAAATSASTATTQASNSATSATAANTAKVAAEAALDQFTDVYLGAFSSDPTVDNDGDALTVGDQYFNTASNVLKIYNGSTWQAAALDSTQFVEVAGDAMSGNLLFGDSVQAQFGDSQDLRIYHDNTHSYIQDAGSGQLKFKTNGAAVQIIDGSNNLMINAQTGSSVDLYHSGSLKFATTSTGIDVTGTVTMDGGSTSADFSFGDNDKAIFGAGSDLQIYHDGLNSIVADAGTGQLRLLGDDVRIYNAAGTEISAQFIQDGEARLKYNNSTKLATKTGGIEVTGTVTADGLTVDGTSAGTLNIVNFLNTDTSANQTANRLGLGISNSAGANYTYIEAKETGVDAFAEMNFYTGSTTTKRLTLSANGDISFYNDSAAQGLFWDSSASRLGLGTTAPAYDIDILDTTTASNTGAGLSISHATQPQLRFAQTTGNYRMYLGIRTNDLVISNDSGAEKVRFEQNGDSTFGGTVSAPLLSVSTSSGKMAEFNSTHANHGYIVLKEDSTEKFYMGASTAVSGQTVGFTFYTASGDGIDFNTGGSNTPKLRITSDGKIGLGVTAPSSPLTVNATGSSEGIRVQRNGVSSQYISIHEATGGDHVIEAYGDKAMNIGNTNAQPLTLKTNNQTRLTIDGSGASTFGGTVAITSNTPIITFTESDQSNKQYQIGSFGAAFSIYDASASSFRVVVDTSGRVGIGGGANANWRNDASDTVLQLGTEATLHSDANVTTELWNNAYVNNSDQYKNISTRGSSRYMQYEGNHRFFTAASASAGSTISMGERMRIDSSGRLGLGTSAPVTQLDVVSNGNTRMLIHTDVDGGLAHLMFKTDSQNLDSRMKGAIIFKRDDPGTRGTGSLHLCVNGVNSDVNAGIADSKLSIDSSGNLLVGSTNNVLGSRAFIESVGSTHVIGARVGANGHYALGAINAAGTVVGGVVVNASSTTYATSSDYRLKENLDYTWDATTRLKQLKPARFNFIADDTNTLVDGFLAHEVSSIVPEAITGTKDAVDADGNPEYQGIDHSVLVPLLVKTIQELEARITALEA